MSKVLVTGAAGFIGFHVVQKLIGVGHQVTGLDNINNYYDVNLKYARLAESGIFAKEESKFLGGMNREFYPIEFYKEISSTKHANYKFYRANLEDKEFILSLFDNFRFEYVIHLAAQAGVRYSIENPDVYIQSNVVGFLSVLEACRKFPVEHLIYASSSSVYGNASKIPFSTNDPTDTPVSLYAATKKTNELMAYTYSYLYKIPATGLRFFTVYGPWGRPDMAPMIFAHAIKQKQPIQVFNKGNLERDFTFVDDIVESLLRVMIIPPSLVNNHQLFNIGNGTPVNLLQFIKTMESALNETAVKNFVEMQPGDVHRTWADTSQLENYIGFAPKTPLEKGISAFMEWYQAYTGPLINE